MSPLIILVLVCGLQWAAHGTSIPIETAHSAPNLHVTAHHSDRHLKSAAARQTDLPKDAPRVTARQTDLPKDAPRVTARQTDLPKDAPRVTARQTDLPKDAPRSAATHHISPKSGKSIPRNEATPHKDARSLESLLPIIRDIPEVLVDSNDILNEAYKILEKWYMFNVTSLESSAEYLLMFQTRLEKAELSSPFFENYRKALLPLFDNLVKLYAIIINGYRSIERNSVRQALKDVEPKLSRPSAAKPKKAVPIC